jgi:hypothetical protein
MFLGNANLLIGVFPSANREIGVPRFAQTQFVPTGRWQALYFYSIAKAAPLVA